MADKRYAELTADGLWHNNPGLVQLLGLCPLLGVSSSTVNALGLGIATILVLIFVSMRKKRENQPPAHLGLPYFREDR